MFDGRLNSQGMKHKIVGRIAGGLVQKNDDRREESFTATHSERILMSTERKVYRSSEGA